jgi:hypothetical protein
MNDDIRNYLIHYMLLPSHSMDSTNTSASSSLQCSYAAEQETKRRKRVLRERRRENAQFRNLPAPTTEQGILWKEYNDLFCRLRREDEDNHTESAHMTQDEIYRKFITDMVGGRFRTQEEIRAMALMMKLNVVDFDTPNHWWYS